jgi:hypothetical protein
MGFNDCHSNKRKAKDYWVYLEDNYKEVATWPSWMRGEPGSSSEDAQTKLAVNGAEDDSDSGETDTRS